MLKIRASLKRRGYSVWIDVEQMQGSTVDAMADAVDESYCIAYALSRECKAAMLSRFHHLFMIALKRSVTADKESANCKLEAMYCHQAGAYLVFLIAFRTGMTLALSFADW